MSRSRILLAFALALCVSCTSVAPQPSAPPAASGTAPAATAGTVDPLPAGRFQILHTNDIHGRLDSTRVDTGTGAFEQGGLALVGGVIAKQRSRAPDRTLVLDAGDAWVGQLISAIDKGRSIVAAMSLAGYDAQALSPKSPGRVVQR